MPDAYNDDSDVDDYNTFHVDRSDASRTADEDPTSDDDDSQQTNQLQFKFDKWSDLRRFDQNLYVTWL